MINSSCDITFENDKISKVITLPCNNEIVTTQYCEVGVLNNGMCEYSVCPDTYTDNGADCKKEVPINAQNCSGTQGYFGRWNNDLPNTTTLNLTIFSSYLIFYDCASQPANVYAQFPFSNNDPNWFVNKPIILEFGNGNLNLIVDTVTSQEIFLKADPFKIAFPNSTFVAGVRRQNNTNTVDLSWTYGNSIKSITINGYKWTQPLQSTIITCPVGSTLIDNKCYQITGKIKTQEVALTRTTIKTKIALPQTITVNKGEVVSNISQAHANALAEELLQNRVNNALPICVDSPTFYNKETVKKGKKICNVGSSCDVIITIPEKTFQSELSQQDVDTQASVEAENRFNAAPPCCILPQVFQSQEKQFIVEKICNIGYTPNPQQLTLTIPMGGNITINNIIIPQFISNISQEEADFKRDNWLTTNLKTFQDLIRCDIIPINDSIYWNVNTTKNNGGTVTPLGNTQVVDKGSFYYIVTPNAGFEIETVTLDGVSQAINDKTRFEQRFLVLSNRNVVVTFKELVIPPLPARQTSSLYLGAKIKSTVVANEIRVSYTVNTINGIVNSINCPCPNNTIGDIGYTSPSGSSFVVGSSGEAVINSFGQYGGSCGSTGCFSGGLGVVSVNINQTHLLSVTAGVNRFVRWEYNYGTALGSGTNQPIFSNIFSATTTVSIPEGCDISVNAIFE